MMYKFTIPGTLSNLNDYLQAERMGFKGKYGRFTTKGNILKHKTQETIIKCIRNDIKGVHIDKQIDIHYNFYEPNKKRDKDNVLSFCMKCTQDSLVLAGVIDNDGWANIRNLSADFYVSKENPHIEVILSEVE